MPNEIKQNKLDEMHNELALEMVDRFPTLETTDNRDNDEPFKYLMRELAKARLKLCLPPICPACAVSISVCGHTEEDVRVMTEEI